jgi:O-antigen/teichoic acid export membrane protein
LAAECVLIQSPMKQDTPTFDSSPSLEPVVVEPEISLKRAAVHGSTITLVGHGIGIAIRVGGNLVITRLLIPEHFGLMALVMVLLVGLHLFSDIGVGPNIIQSPHGEDPTFLDTAWTVQISRGFFLWAIACCLAWPMAVFYQKPELVFLVPVVGLSAVLGGFESTKLFTVNRSLSFVRLTALELVAQLAGVLAMVAAGWIYRSVWALVVSGLVSSASRTILSHAVLPGHSNRLCWDASARKSLVDFGRWIFVSSAVTFLAGQGDRLILGKLVSASELGLYSIAGNLATMPTSALMQVTNKVFYPVVAAVMRDTNRDMNMIRQVRIKLLLVLTPAFALAIAMSPELIALLYDPRYHRVGRITSWLLIGTWLSIVGSSYGVVLLANAQPKFLSFAQATKTAVFFVLIMQVAPRWGIEAVALAVSLSEIASLALVAYGSRELKIVTVFHEIGFTVLGIALIGVYRLLYGGVLMVTGPIAAFAITVVVGLGLTAVFFKRVRLV